MFLSYAMSKFIFTIWSLVLTLILYWLFRRLLLALLTLAVCVLVIFVPDQIAMSRWEQLCRTDSGSRVYETNSVDGFYFEGGGIEGAAFYLKKGYRYVEFDSWLSPSKGPVGTVSANKSEIYYNGKTVLSKYKYSLINYAMNDELSASEKRITEIESGKVVARTKTLYFFGGPFYRAMQKIKNKKLSDFIAMCPITPPADSIVEKAIPPK